MCVYVCVCVCVCCVCVCVCVCVTGMYNFGKSLPVTGSKL